VNDTYEQARTDAEMLARFTYHTGWGVSVGLIWEGEDEPERVTDIEVGVTRIASDTVRLVGNTLCVPFDVNFQHPQSFWIPVQDFKPDLPLVNNDSHDARSHWFATESEAREHAKFVQDQWDNPQPWESFIQTDYDEI
jgi:hypothetical protein